MRYGHPERKSKAEIERIFAEGSPYEVSEALISAAMHEQDRAWVEKWIITHARHGDAGVRCSAAVGLGHVARLHRVVSTPVVEAVAHLLEDADTAGSAEDGLDDVRIFAERS